MKLIKAGVATERGIAAVARVRGTGLMVCGNVELILAMTVLACLAAGSGGYQFADLDPPMSPWASPSDGGDALSGGTIPAAQISVALAWTRAGRREPTSLPARASPTLLAAR